MKYFNDYNEYKYFLMNKMNELQNKEEYNIFAHIITVFSKDVQFLKKSEEEISAGKANSILKNGLFLNYNNIYRYTSMNGTTNFLGSTKNVDVENIINYVYDQPAFKNRNVVLFAVPKYLNIDNVKTEFSSYKGICRANNYAKINFPEVVEEILNYKDNNCNYRDIHHAKYSLLDCILEDRIPKEFILGVQSVYPTSHQFKFIENSNHIFEMDKERRSNYNKFLENKVKNIGFNANKNNALEIMSRKTKSDIETLNSLEYDEI